MKRWKCIAILLVIMTIGVPCLWAGQETYETNDWIRHTDIENSSDMKGISRFQGSIIQYYNVANWDKYILPVSKLEASGGKKIWSKKLTLEGKITRIQYSVNRKNNPAFINRNYEAALKGAGWKVLFKGCGNDELGNDSYEWCFYYYGSEGLNNDKWGSAFGPRGRNHCYLAARLDDPFHTYYAAIYTVDYENSANGLALTLITQDVIEVKKAQTGLVKAGKMADGLSAKGHIALYGLNFDTGKANIKPSSVPALKQIAGLLKQQRGLNLYVVGHTDDLGNFDSNMALSKARADAVVQRLVHDYHIPSGRLQAGGVGPLAPVATNDTDDGRAMNRRVELVKTIHKMSAAGPSRSMSGVPSFDIKQDAVLHANGLSSQTPVSASTVAKPGKVNTPPKLPPKLIPIPSVVGKFKLKAQKILKKQGFKVSIRGHKVGIVTAQSPKANLRVTPGSTVTITIGK